VSRDPAAALDGVCDLLRLADDVARRVTGEPLGGAAHIPDLHAIAAWMRDHPHLTASIADAMPQET
jgi:hypothetical protein